MKIEDLLELLATHGGKIVSTTHLNITEIKQARASNRMYVDSNYLGYVWIPSAKTIRNKEQFEKWYPISLTEKVDIINDK